ncbi:MAG: zinc ribbon domain-containing protein [Deltaproteobacteria bacterium]|nr:zinc ribbon domain-containing protein [Deltaproteobacteria bacterium]
MPILKYRCSVCEKEFAKIFFRPEAAPRACPVCGAKDPIEMGPAFDSGEQSIARAMCGSCDACGGDDASCDHGAGSA